MSSGEPGQPGRGAPVERERWISTAPPSARLATADAKNGGLTNAYSLGWWPMAQGLGKLAAS